MSINIILRKKLDTYILEKASDSVPEMLLGAGNKRNAAANFPRNIRTSSSIQKVMK